MRASRFLAVCAVLAAVGATAGCRAIEPACAGAITSPRIPFLETEVGRALHSLREAREVLPAEGGDAGESLDQAEAALLRLQGYYLPLLESRLRASNAHQLAAGGNLSGAANELEHIEEALLGVARTGGTEMGREVRDPLDLLEEARVALAESSPDAPERLEDLAERLELMLLKGDLVLP
jgi:hypothetical protein